MSIYASVQGLKKLTVVVQDCQVEWNGESYLDGLCRMCLLSIYNPLHNTEYVPGETRHQSLLERLYQFDMNANLEHIGPLSDMNNGSTSHLTVPEYHSGDLGLGGARTKQLHDVDRKLDIAQFNISGACHQSSAIKASHQP